jgi:hypothetical protein
MIRPGGASRGADPAAAAMLQLWGGGAVFEKRAGVFRRRWLQEKGQCFFVTRTEWNWILVVVMDGGCLARGAVTTFLITAAQAALPSNFRRLARAWPRRIFAPVWRPTLQDVVCGAGGAGDGEKRRAEVRDVLF